MSPADEAWVKELYEANALKLYKVAFRRLGDKDEAENVVQEAFLYPTLQDAFDAHSISEPLAPSWIPEGYVLDYVEASPSTGQVVFTASYSSGQSILNLMYSYRMDGTFSSSIFEKDGSSVIEYTKNGIVHYIMSNVNVRVAAWVNGTCECSITGPLTEQEMITIIDSIYT